MIDIKHLRKEFDKHVVLNDISEHIHPGEVVVIWSVYIENWPDNHGNGNATIEEFRKHWKIPADVKVIRVPCSCRVNPTFILRAFQRGADGVIICGCHPGDCHYTSGNYYTRRRMAALFSMLDFLGIEKERTRVEWVSAAEGAKFAATMNDFVEKVTALGENKRLEDLRCKR